MKQKTEKVFACKSDARGKREKGNKKALSDNFFLFVVFALSISIFSLRLCAMSEESAPQFLSFHHTRYTVVGLQHGKLFLGCDNEKRRSARVQQALAKIKTERIDSEEEKCEKETLAFLNAPSKLHPNNQDPDNQRLKALSDNSEPSSLPLSFALQGRRSRIEDDQFFTSLPSQISKSRETSVSRPSSPSHPRRETALSPKSPTSPKPNRLDEAKEKSHLSTRLSDKKDEFFPAPPRFGKLKPSSALHPAFIIYMKEQQEEKKKRKRAQLKKLQRRAPKAKLSPLAPLIIINNNKKQHRNPSPYNRQESP